MDAEETWLKIVDWFNSVQDGDYSWADVVNAAMNHRVLWKALNVLKLASP
jgi:hypothetical protein